MSNVYRSGRGDFGGTGPVPFHGAVHPPVAPDPANISEPSASRRRRPAPPETTGQTAREEAVRADLRRQPTEPARLSTGALLAREHELARARAAHIDGTTAGEDLARRLAFAHRHAGKPSLAMLSMKVGYSKGTLSKVLNGKMAPTWALVRKLGEHLRVPPHHVTQEWLPLWIAADEHRELMKAAEKEAQEKNNIKGVARGTAAVHTRPEQPPAPIDLRTGTAPRTDALTEETGYACSQCGSWVVNTAQHTSWHMKRDPDGQPAPDAESTGAGQANTAELALLKQIFPMPEDS
jgi:transcriptional regulator with XRE-family HTH domain